MRTPVTTLGGIVLEGQKSYDWTLRYGTRPVEAIWTISEHAAKQFEGRLGEAMELVIEGPRATLNYRNIFPLELYPGSKPYTRRLLLKDLRWQWPYHWLKATFNKPRLTGERFLLNDAGPPENAVTDPTLIWEKTTLFPFTPSGGSQPWRALDILEHLLGADSPDGLGETVILDVTDPGFDVQYLEIDDQGQRAIERVLAYLGGVDVYVSPSGGVVVRDTRDPEGENVARRTRHGRKSTGPESLEVVREAVRPSKVVTLFTPEPELRLDFDEAGSGSDVEDDNTLTNVARVPDFSLSVGGETLARGSLASLADLFTAWGAFGVTGEQITLAILRSRAFEQGFARFEAHFSHAPGPVFDSQFAARAATVVDAWRQLYRIDETFFGRLGSIAPVRAAILNPRTGTRAPSPVYSDYIRRPSMRGLYKGPPSGVEHGWKVEGHDGGDITSDTREAPARVVLEDGAVGVLRVVPQNDLFGLTQRTVLGYPQDGEMPRVDGLGAANRELLKQMYAQWAYVKLRAAYFMSTIVSVTPATPQNRTQFYALETDIPDGKGPVLYSRIFPGFVTARFAWSDALGDQIKSAIRGEGDWQGLSGQLVNEEHLKDVHDANVKRTLDEFRDRTVGGHDVDMDPGIEPVGSLGEVRQIMASGATVTQMRWVPDARHQDIWHLLPAPTRRALLRSMLAPQGTGATSA